MLYRYIFKVQYSLEDFWGWLYNFGHTPHYEMILIDSKNPNHIIVGHHGENIVVTFDYGETNAFKMIYNELIW